MNESLTIEKKDSEQAPKKIEFIPLTPENKALYDRFLPDGRERGCEYTFANMYLWGQMQVAVLDGCLVMCSQYEGMQSYLYPVGTGDIPSVLAALASDARARGVSFRINVFDAEAKEQLESVFPGQLRYRSNEGYYDYVYSIDDLADLKGKKYHGKRNHFTRFASAHEGYVVEPISESNLQEVKCLAERWYADRLAVDPDADFRAEQRALDGAFLHYRAFQMEGIALRHGGELLAFTLASRLSEDTFDVHFEKALAGVEGAYAAINCEFARYLRNKYPDVRFLNREEDMGIEGLRKAKQSYHPHHMMVKEWAFLKEDADEN